MMPGTRQKFLERIPKGFRNKAQGCEERATLGKGGSCLTTPTGLWPRLRCRCHGPQPFALLRNPFGIRHRRTATLIMRTPAFGVHALACRAASDTLKGGHQTL